MGRGRRFQESDATDEENEYSYRVEWDDAINVSYDMDAGRAVTEHYGSGSREYDDFDNAWDAFNDCRDDSDYIGVRLIKIDDDGNESTYASS